MLDQRSRFPRSILSLTPAILLALSIAACAGSAAPAPKAAATKALSQRDAYSKQGDACLAKEDLEGAYRNYVLAEDGVALAGLEDRLIEAGSYQLYLDCWRELHKTLVIDEDFADNSNSWNLREDDYSTGTIEDGTLHIKRTMATGAATYWPSVGIDPKLDFKIEARVTKVGGSDTEACFITWSFKDSQNNFHFGVSGDGSYEYGADVGGVWTRRIDWKKSESINKGMATNTLEALRIGPRLEFYVNDTLVDSAPSESLYDGTVGISLGTGIEAKVEHFLVEQFPPESEPCNAAGNDAFAKADFQDAIRFFSLAGNVDRLDEMATGSAAGGQLDLARAALRGKGLSAYEARILLASKLASLGKKPEALAELGAAGWKLDGGLSKTLMRESFADNSRNWAEADNENAVLQVTKGAYRFQCLASDGWNTWDSIPIDPGADFKIEAALRKVSGPDDRTCSLIWGFSALGQKQDFGFTGAGGFEYGYFADGKWHSVLKADKSAAVRTGGAQNLLAVVRAGDKLRFFIDGLAVGEAPYREFLGDRIGFGLYAPMTMEADSLSVTEYPPAFAVDVARTELYGARPVDFAEASGAALFDRGLYREALASFGDAKDLPGEQGCNLRLGDEARLAGDDAGAVAYYLKAGDGADACRGLIAAYAALGQADKAQDPKSRLADLLFTAGKPDEALALYRELTKSAYLDAAGLRYYGAADYGDAADLFEAAGDDAKEKDCYGHMADAQAQRGQISDAVSLYRKAGKEAKAAALEKRLVGLSASPQLGAVSGQSTTGGTGAFGFRIIDSSGYSIEIGEPWFANCDPWASQSELEGSGASEPESLTLADAAGESKLSAEDFASANFDWAKKTVSVVASSGDRRSLKIPDEGLDSFRLLGYVYQAGIRCLYQIELGDVKSIARIEATGGSYRASDGVASWARACDLTDRTGVTYSLTDAGLYCESSFSSGYSYWGVGSGFRGKCLEEADSLAMALGKGSYAVPLSEIARLSLKDGYFISSRGLRCPLMGKLIDLVAIAGATPRGRVALYASAIADLVLARASPQSAAPPRSEPASGDGSSSPGWSLSCYHASSGSPFLRLKTAKSEIYSPDIDWGASDNALAFRAALEDYSEGVKLNEDSTAIFWDKTMEAEVVPIQIGQACWAIPFRTIKEFGMDAKGGLSVTLDDGKVLRGLPYKNWTGLAGVASSGAVNLSRKELPARAVVASATDAATSPAVAPTSPAVAPTSPTPAPTGAEVKRARDLAISGTLTESMRQVYGQRDYLDWSLELSMANEGGGTLSFGKDLILMDCHGQLYDGAYLSYTPGAPASSPATGDFDPESQAYAIANFEDNWGDGTMRGFRNGGTFTLGDPPDSKPQPTICNTKLAAGTSTRLSAEFTQGSYVDPHDRVLVALPAVSGPSGSYRLILGFVKADPGKGAWSLRSVQAIRLTTDELLASYRAAKGDPPIRVLSLHWLAALDPVAASSILKEGICGTLGGQDRIASIQLLENAALKPDDEETTAIKAIATGDKDDWSAKVARRFLGEKED
jgi:tetratricopeptide (TPR) repeat protein